MNKILILTSAILVSTASQLPAEMVHYVDENGRTQYVDTDYATVPEQYLSQITSQLTTQQDQLSTNPDATIPIVTSSDVTPQNPIILNPDGTRPIVTSSDVTTQNPIIVNPDGTRPIVTSSDVTAQNPTIINPDGTRPIVTSSDVTTQNPVIVRPPTTGGTQTKNITLYLKNDCQECMLQGMILRKEGAAFTTVDVETADGKVAYDGIGRPSLPAAKVGDELITGFNPNRVIASSRSTEPQQPVITDVSPTSAKNFVNPFQR